MRHPCRKNEMKLRKNEIEVPMNFSVSPWEIPFSSVGNSIFLGRKLHFHTGETPFSCGGKSIFMPMKILAVLKRTKTKMRQSTNDSDASSLNIDRMTRGVPLDSAHPTRWGRP